MEPDFSQYDLIIDVRTQREYEEDHIPGAINLPVVNTEEYAEVGILHRTDPMGAYQIGAQYALRNIARYIGAELAGYDRKCKVLVYCFRGGKRSRSLFDVMDNIGYKVERLKGGWKGYRRWVNEQLLNIPTQFSYKVLSGPTGCGKTRLLTALQRAGAQVLDLEDIAVHRGSIIGGVPGRAQPTQKHFDSLLLEQLRKFDVNKPVWVEAESKKIGNVQLPTALLDAMRKSQTFAVNANMDQRVKLLLEDYQHFVEDPRGLVERLSFLRPLVGGEEIDAWSGLAAEKNMPVLFERLMRNHYDPTYRRSILRNYPDIDQSPQVLLDDLSHEALFAVAKKLREQFEP